MRCSILIAVVLVAIASSEPIPSGSQKVTRPLSERRSDPCVNNGLDITLHGGNIMPHVNVYVIWYGNWAGNSGTTILTSLLSNLGPSSWWGTNIGYNGVDGQAVSHNVVLAGSITDAYSQGTYLPQMGAIYSVYNAIAGGLLPDDPDNGIYLVLGSADVGGEGFCTQWCGYHSYFTLSTPNSGKYKFSLVIDPTTQCLSSCSAQPSLSPNGNPGADAMASVISHELAEAATDPIFDGWYDANGCENSDKCAWTFGNVFTAPNGALYNVYVGSSQFLLQLNFNNLIQACESAGTTGSVVTTGRVTTGQATTGRATTGQATTGRATTGQATTGQATTGQATTGQATTGQATTGRATTGQATTGQATTGAAGAFQTFFYYYTNAHIRRWDGTTLIDLFTHAWAMKSNIVFDTTNNRLIFRDTRGAGAGIYSCDLTGNNVLALFIDGNTNGDMDLAIDNVNGKIYFHNADGYIHRMNLDGSSQQQFVASSPYVAIAVDPARNFLYYSGTIFGSDYNFYRVNLSNPAGGAFHVDSQYADAISMGANGTVFMETGGTIYKYVYNGGNSYTKTSNLIAAVQYFNTFGLGVAPNGDIYFTCYNCGANSKGAYTVFQMTTGGVITTIQNGDSSGSEGPWGGVVATLAVQSTTGQATTGRATTGQATTGQATTGQATTGQATTGQATTGQATTGRATTGQATTGQATTSQATTGQATTGQATTGQATTGQATTGQATTGQATTGQVTTGQATTGSASTTGSVGGLTACQILNGDDQYLHFAIGSASYSFDQYSFISFGNFSSNTGNIDGRLAVKNQFAVGSGYSIGSQVSSVDTNPFSLVVGQDATFLSGSIAPYGSVAFVGGNFNAPGYLQAQRSSFVGSGILDSFFDSAQSYYTQQSNALSQLSDNVQQQVQWSTLNLVCNSASSAQYVVTLAPATFSEFTSYSVSENCNPAACWVINVPGTGSVQIAGNFPLSDVVYNVLGSSRTISVNSATGAILAPNNVLYQVGGSLTGKVIVGDAVNIVAQNLA